MCGFRRFGGIVLMLVLAPVATANALACGLECVLASRAEHHEHHAAPVIHLSGQERSGPAVSSSHFCQALQPLSPTFVTPRFPEPPAITARFSPVDVQIAAGILSVTTDFNTPPPRA